MARKLAEGKELAQLSQKLAQIVTDAPVELDLDKCRFELAEEEKKRVVEKFKELGFRSLVARLEGENKQSLLLRNKKPAAETQKKNNSQQELFNH